MSNKTMTLTDISKSSKQFKDTHTLQVGGFKDNGGRITAAEVQKELRDSVAAILNEMQSSNHKLLISINKINDRLDQHEHIIRNDLLPAVNKINDRLDRFEQFVLDQFKKHGWVE